MRNAPQPAPSQPNSTRALANIAKSIISQHLHQQGRRFVLNLIKLDRSDLFLRCCFYQRGTAVAIPLPSPYMPAPSTATQTRQTRQQEDTRFRLMQILHANPDISQREMAKALGISFGGVNYCLNALMAKGLVKVQNFSQSQNKFGYVYLLTPAGIAEKMALTGSFLKRKMDEYEALRLEIEALQSEIDAKPTEAPGKP
jgi:EPS-associated MarR family transcriptional regulator